MDVYQQPEKADEVSERGSVVSAPLRQCNYDVLITLGNPNIWSSIASPDSVKQLTMFAKQENRLVFSYDADKLWVEPWGKNALRIRATQLNKMPSENWALEGSSGPDAQIEIGEKSSSLTNGEIKAVVSAKGKLTVYGHGGKIILDEAVRNRRDVLDPKCSAIDREAREFQAIPSTNDYHIVWRLESLDKDEKIYGMGQYQQPYLDLKGLDLELAHRNSQASVPFAVSSLGYGILWNNPGIGRAVFGKNVMSFEALSSTVLDCWLVAGETPAEIVQAYAGVTGTVPMMPEVSTLAAYHQRCLFVGTSLTCIVVWSRFLAMQAPLPNTGRTTRRCKRIQSSSVAYRSHCDRLLPLAATR